MTAEYKKIEINISLSTKRKLYYIFNSKEKQKILDECTYYSSIYKGVAEETMVDAVVSKYIKMKLHQLIFLNNKKEIQKYKEWMMDTYKGLDEF